MSEKLKNIEFNKSAIVFGLDLYQHMNQNEECKNIIYSPISIHLGLGLMSMGAAGKTREALASALRVADNRLNMANSFHHVICKYKESPSVTFASKIYLQNGILPKGRFQAIAERVFRAEIENVDFTDPRSVAEDINSWVASKTNNKIYQLTNAQRIDPDALLILVNTTCFQCEWKYPFGLDSTKEGDFWINSTDSLKLPLMWNQQADIRCSVSPSNYCVAIELPFKDEDFSMLILMPHPSTEINELEREINDMDFVEFRKSLIRASVEFCIPKFRFEYKIRLRDSLKKMGFSPMFTAGADFSDLLETKIDIHVNQILHKTYIDVNEAGVSVEKPTEPTPSTHFIPDHTIIVDHPFLFAILSKRHRLLFWGSIRNPDQAKCEFLDTQGIIKK